MPIKISIDGNAMQSLLTEFPCLKITDNDTILLFKNSNTCTIIYNECQENIGMQYSHGEYPIDRQRNFAGILSLSNLKNI